MVFAFLQVAVVFALLRTSKMLAPMRRAGEKAAVN